MEKLAVVINTNTGNNIFCDDLVKSVQNAGYDTELLQGRDFFDPRDHDATHVFLSGVPTDASYSLSESETKSFISQRYDWLKDIRIPVMGICFGHQIVGHIFGEKVRTMVRPRFDDQYRLKVTNGLGIFKGIESIPAYVAHHDHVRLPSDFSCLASRQGVCYAMKHHDKDIYGLQFKPDKSNETGRELINRFMKLS